jgi:hypothetical protein
VLAPLSPVSSNAQPKVTPCSAAASPDSPAELAAAAAAAGLQAPYEEPSAAAVEGAEAAPAAWPGSPQGSSAQAPEAWAAGEAAEAGAPWAAPAAAAGSTATQECLLGADAAAIAAALNATDGITAAEFEALFPEWALEAAAASAAAQQLPPSEAEPPGSRVHGWLGSVGDAESAAAPDEAASLHSQHGDVPSAAHAGAWAAAGGAGYAHSQSGVSHVSTPRSSLAGAGRVSSEGGVDHACTPHSLAADVPAAVEAGAGSRSEGGAGHALMEPWAPAVTEEPSSGGVKGWRWAWGTAWTRATVVCHTAHQEAAKIEQRTSQQAATSNATARKHPTPPCRHPHRAYGSSS